MITKDIVGGVVHEVPEDLREALSADSKALEAWDGLTPLARNEWICWTTFVKKQETRKEHVRRVITELKEGISRPCCWIGCIHRTDKEISPSVKYVLNSRKAKLENNEMSYIVDFEKVSTIGLETSPVSQALAGLRANEARYFMNKYNHTFTVVPVSESQETLNWVNRILKEDRGIEFSAKPLQTSLVKVENLKWAFVFYEDGLEVNVLYSIDESKKRAVGFKLSEGMEIPKELEGKFKFARQRSKLAGIIRGSYFVIKGNY